MLIDYAVLQPPILFQREARVAPWKAAFESPWRYIRRMSIHVVQEEKKRAVRSTDLLQHSDCILINLFCAPGAHIKVRNVDHVSQQSPDTLPYEEWTVSVVVENRAPQIIHIESPVQPKHGIQ